MAYGFLSLPDLRTLHRASVLMIECGDIPEGWRTHVTGGDYRPRILWYDHENVHRLTVIYYPEPWRQLAYLRIEEDPTVGSIWDCSSWRSY